jgi:thiamine-phosphate pyrophosphorylase
MGSAHVLGALARRLNHEAGSPPIPALYFFTDPDRTPDPTVVAKRLPRGAAVVYRHFGAANRASVARQLARICRRRGLTLLIGADPALARRVGADGVHWPERMLANEFERFGLTTAATHSAAGVAHASVLGVHACVLSPVFPTRSAAGRKPLGLSRASQLAHLASVPVIALGGVNPDTANRLAGRGFAGLAAVDSLVSA